MLLRARLDKKGIFAYEGVMWIMRSIILVFLLLSLIFITSAFLVKSIDTRLADSYVLMNFLYYSGNGIMLEDAATGRVYPGIVSLGSFEKIELKGALFSYGEVGGEGFIGAQLTVPLNANGKTTPYLFVYDKDAFNDWNFLYAAGLTKGLGGVSKFSTAKSLIAAKSGQFSNSDSTFEVVMKNA